MNEKTSFKCEICDYSSSRKFEIKQHVESVHEGKKSFKCKLCCYSSNEKFKVNQHFESVHEEKKLHKCQICVKRFTFMDSLKRHVIHTQGEEALQMKIL